MNILGDDQLHRENISIFLTHALGQRTVTKNAECHNHSQIELMLNKSALSVFSNWAPQKQFHQVTDEVNIKRQRDEIYKRELIEEEEEQCGPNNFKC